MRGSCGFIWNGYAPRKNNMTRESFYDLVYFGTGTANDPFKISRETYREMCDWLYPKEMEVHFAPADEQVDLIEKYRAEAKSKWPWWFPHCHVHVRD